MTTFYESTPTISYPGSMPSRVSVVADGHISLACGIGSFVLTALLFSGTDRRLLFVALLLAVVATAFGITGRRQSAAGSPGRQAATAGMALGICTLVMFALFIAAILVIVAMFSGVQFG